MAELVKQFCTECGKKMKEINRKASPYAKDELIVVMICDPCDFRLDLRIGPKRR